MNLGLVLLYAGTVAASLGLAGLIYWLVQHRRSLRFHVRVVRLTSAEVKHVSEAAQVYGMTASEFLKRSAIQKGTDQNLAGTYTSASGFGYVMFSRSAASQASARV